MKKIYFIRHGQTDYNIKQLIQGAGIDAELNDTGIKQAYEVKDKLKNIHLDKVYTSPLKRAMKTANIICEDRNITAVPDDRLKELYLGDFEGTGYGCYDYDGFWNVNNPHLYEGTEDVRNLVKRVFNLIDDIKNSKEENVLLVGHGGVSKAVAAYFYGIPEDGQINKLIKVENCEVIEFKLN